MRIHVLSDLHLVFGEFAPGAVTHNVVVLASDIWLRAQGPHWAAGYSRDLSQLERMNRTINDATVKRFYCDSHTSFAGTSLTFSWPTTSIEDSRP